MTTTLLREFKSTESSHPFIIPALKNGLIVKVTKKIAREFALCDPGIIVGGTVKYINFQEVHLGLVTMTIK
jgi:hypothetical protein